MPCSDLSSEAWRSRGGWLKGKRVGTMISELSLGIDFKLNHIILTLLRKSLRGITLVGGEIHPLPSEAQKEEREGEILNLIGKFLSKYHLNKDKTSISVPREKTVIRFITLPIATKENLRKVVEYEVPKYTPFEREEVYFDYQILKEEKDWLHLYAVFMKKIELDPYLSLLKKIGIEPFSVQIPSVGALNLFHYHKGAKENEISVLLDVAEPFIEMNLLQGRDWRESVSIPSPREGKELKILEILNRLGVKGEALTKSTFFVYGLGADESLPASLKETDQVKEALPPPLNRIEAGKGKSIPYQIYPSVGLPLVGLTKTWVDLNLLPVKMRKKVRQIGKPLLIILTSMAILLALSWPTGIFIQYKNELKAVQVEMQKRRPAVEAIEKLQKNMEGLNREVSEFNKIKSEEISKIEILEELAKLLPSTVWIWNFKYTGKEMEISGFADSASDLISLLDKSPLFERVEFLAPVTKDREKRDGVDKERERFKIKVRMEGRN
jgi:general secretion pathway protein L